LHLSSAESGAWPDFESAQSNTIWPIACNLLRFENSEFRRRLTSAMRHGKAKQFQSRNEREGARTDAALGMVSIFFDNVSRADLWTDSDVSARATTTI